MHCSFCLLNVCLRLCVTAATKKTVIEAPSLKTKVLLNDDNIEECEDLGYVMLSATKKALLDQVLPKSVESQLKTLRIEKPNQMHLFDPDLFQMSEDEDDDDDDNVEVIINDPFVNTYDRFKKFMPLDQSTYRTKG